MATHQPSLKAIEIKSEIAGAAEKNITIVHTQWNSRVVGSLVEGARGELLRQGVKPANIRLISVRRCTGGAWRWHWALEALSLGRTGS